MRSNESEVTAAAFLCITVSSLHFVTIRVECRKADTQSDGKLNMISKYKNTMCIYKVVCMYYVFIELFLAN